MLPATQTTKTGFALMITCRSCGSRRLQKGYRRPPFLLRLLLIRSFLCDHCNSQFFAFSLRTPKSHNRRAHSVAETIQKKQSVDLSRLNDAPSPSTSPHMQDDETIRLQVLRESALSKKDRGSSRDKKTIR
jgi:hypothetical protein